MILGVDFDNTIISYDRVFHQAAVSEGLIAPDLPANKTAVRDALRRAGREAAWTALQGHVYGRLMRHAPPFAGAIAFFLRCRRQGVPVRIISHKTREPVLGPRYDLHETAQAWLAAQGFYDPQRIGLRPQDVAFELTKAAKLSRIEAAGCTHFIDDLPEFLAESAFPPGVERILFDPADVYRETGPWQRATSWAAIDELIFARVGA